MSTSRDQFVEVLGLDLLHLTGKHPVLNSFPHGALVVFDHELRYVAAGGRGLAEVGLTREQLVGRTIQEAFGPEVVEQIEPLYRAALRGEDTETDVPYAGRIFLQRLGPVRDDEGTIVAGMGFTQDVTSVREAFASLQASQERLVEEHRRLEEAQEIGSVGSWEQDLGTGVLVWSDAMLALYGIDPADFAGDYAEALLCVHPDDRARVDASVHRCLSAGSDFEVRYRVVRADDGELRWFNAKGRVLHDDDGVAVRLAGAVADVTRQVEADQEARRAQAFHNAVLTASPDLTMVIDLDTGRLVFGSREKGIVGRTTDEATALSYEERVALVHPDDRPQFEGRYLVARGLADGALATFRYRVRHVDDTWHWIDERICPFVRDGHDTVTQALSVLRDVTDVVEAEHRLAYAALHDQLTGLPNRALLFDRLNVAMVRAAHEGRDVAVLYCDLDGFKQVNDSFGHATGDAVLIGAAQRISGALREGDTVARVGGDEFVMLVEPWNRSTSPEDRGGRDQDRSFAWEVAQRIITALQRPVTVDGVEHTVTASIGIAYTTGAGGSAAADQAVLRADSAMYAAKSRGRGCVSAYGVDGTLQVVPPPGGQVAAHR